MRIATVEQLKSWFFLNKHPYWTLSYGQQKSTNNIVGSNMELSDVNQAWEHLELFLEQLSDGKYHLEVKSSATTSRGCPGMVFQVGDLASASVTGIGGYPAAMPSASNAESVKLREEITELKLKLAEKDNDRKLDELKREIVAVKESNTFTERIMGVLESNAPVLIEKLFGSAPGAQVGIAGLGENSAELNRATTDNTIDLNSLVNSAYMIQEAIPQINVNEVFNKLAEYCKGNPQQAVTMINML